MNLHMEEIPFNLNLLRRVKDLELSVRSANCLRNEEIYYVGELVQRTEVYMMSVPNFGRKSFRELKDVLAEMNLSFGLCILNWPHSNTLDALHKEGRNKDLDAIRRSSCNTFLYTKVYEIR